MVSQRYIPAAGDLVWTSFDPQSGHEQAGRRPALVLSPASYNGKVGLALACPVTSQVKGYPFEVSLMSKHVRASFPRTKSAAWIGARDNLHSSNALPKKLSLPSRNCLRLCWSRVSNDLPIIRNCLLRRRASTTPLTARSSRRCPGSVASAPGHSVDGAVRRRHNSHVGRDESVVGVQGRYHGLVFAIRPQA